MSAEARLFDDKRRTDGSRGRHDESTFAFLDRVDDVVFGRVRVLLNQWFSHWPAEHADGLRRRFGSRDASQFSSAFWELYLHEACRRFAQSVTVEPLQADTSRRRDFVVVLAEESRLALEARVLIEPDTTRARERRLSRAFDLIDKIPNQNFSIDLDLEREGAGNPPGAQLRDQIAAWLAGLDRSELRPLLEAGRWRELPSQSFSAGDWIVRARALPVSDDAAASPPRDHGVIGVYPGRGGSSNPDRIRASLHGKRSARYGSAQLPYVVAVLDDVPFSGAHTLLDALFGDEAVVIPRDAANASSATVVRRNNGFWGPARNTRLSAVLYGQEIMPWSVASVWPTLWRNPWAANPVTAQLPWVEHAEGGPVGKISLRGPDIPPHEFFDLPAGWPGPERPFGR